MAEILIIEDDTDINNMTAEVLRKHGYGCVQAFSGTEGLHYAKDNRFSLILTDLMLPGLGGAEVVKEIRKSSSVPIIVVSAKDELDSKVDLLTLGADDYLTKPFEMKELLARIMVRLRSTNDIGNGGNGTLIYKELKLDKENYSIYCGGSPLSLTRQEYKILELLISNPTKVFSKNDIYKYAWDDYYIGEDKTINVHISNIRRKIKTITNTEYIETVWGIGFKLQA